MKLTLAELSYQNQETFKLGDKMKTEEQISQLPKRNNYHYNVEHVDNVECMVLYYKLSDNMWNRHVGYCKENGFKNDINQWVRILIDVENFEKIYGWSIGITLAHLKPSCSNKTPYIQVDTQKAINKKIIRKIIHRHILNPPKELQIDHINHNTLDNRKCNLRLATRGENCQNKRGAFSNSKTGIRGVSIKVKHKNTKYQKQYYVAQVVLSCQFVLQKYYPLTPQGLIDAEKAVIETRLKYFTHSEMDKVC